MAETSVRSPLDVARQVAPSIRSYADQIEQARELPRPLFEALADAGLFHLPDCSIYWPPLPGRR